MIIMGRTLAKYNYFDTGFPVVYDKTNAESLVTMFPVTFYDDFLGSDVAFPGTGTAEAGCKWSMVLGLGGLVAKVADGLNGIVSLALSNADEAQIAVLSWNDQESLSLNQGLIFEARLCFSVLPLTGTTIVSAVFGLAGAHNADLDAGVDCNAWFRVESGANTVLLWETDDNATDDDDNICAGITLAANVYHIYRIDATDIAAVKFYVDGVLVGTGSMAGLVTPIWSVQPYFNVSKTDPPAVTTGTGTMLIDYVRVFQDRS